MPDVDPHVPTPCPKCNETFDNPGARATHMDHCLADGVQSMDIATGWSIEEAIDRAKGLITETISNYDDVGLHLTGGADSTALVFLAREELPTFSEDVDVVFHRHGDHFPETVEYVHDLTTEYDLPLKEVGDYPRGVGDDYDAMMRASRLWETPPEKRTDENTQFHHRYFQEAQSVDWVWAAPMLNWRKPFVFAFLQRPERRVPVNPLYEQGARQVDRQSNTTLPDDDDDDGDGRPVQTSDAAMQRLEELGYI